MDSKTVFSSEFITSELGMSLRKELLRIGFIDVMQSLTRNQYPHHIISLIIEHFPTQLQATFNFFVLAKQINIQDLPVGIAKLLPDLENAGLARRIENKYTIAPLSLYVINELLYFAEFPNPAFSIYLGEDSYALLERRRKINHQHSRVLDLCSGPGIQGISYGNQADHIDLVEINPIAAQLAKCNANLNSLGKKITIYNSDAQSFIKNKNFHKYDLVICNPPLVPIPENFHFNLVSHGGWDGLRIIKPILKNIDILLAPEAEFLSIGISSITRSTSRIWTVLKSLENQINATIILTYLRIMPISPLSDWVKLISQSLRQFNFQNKKIADYQVYEAYKANKVDSVVLYTISISKKQTTKAPICELKTINLATIKNSKGGWKLSFEQ